MMLQSGAKSATSVASRTTRVHLGCGLNTPQGWINVDGSWNARLTKYPALRKLLGSLHIAPRALTNIAWDRQLLCHDLRKVLPFADNSVEAIYASHLVEHLYHEEAKRLLQECFRVLKPAGVLRLVVPSLETIVAEYMGGEFLRRQRGSGEFHTSRGPGECSIGVTAHDGAWRKSVHALL
jgi:SAM-dependent methyltransferase